MEGCYGGRAREKRTRNRAEGKGDASRGEYMDQSASGRGRGKGLEGKVCGREAGRCAEGSCVEG